LVALHFGWAYRGKITNLSSSKIVCQFTSVKFMDVNPFSFFVEHVLFHTIMHRELGLVAMMSRVEVGSFERVGAGVVVTAECSETLANFEIRTLSKGSSVAFRSFTRIL
jgi:hypothetical protein